MNIDRHTRIADQRIKRILEDATARLAKMPDISCIFLRSSYAIGTATPQSDIDIGVIIDGDTRNEIWTEYEIPVHVHYLSAKVIDIVKKDEETSEFLEYLPTLKSLTNTVPLLDPKGVLSFLQKETSKRKQLFAKVHLNEMGKQLNDADGLFQNGAYEDTIINVRKATREGVMALLSMIGMPGAKDKYLFSLFSNQTNVDAESRKKARGVLRLVRRIHDLEECDQSMAANHLLCAWDIFKSLSSMLEKNDP